MIKITIELIPAGGGPTEILGVGYIGNDGTGSHAVGNYKAWLLKKGHNRLLDACRPSYVWRATGVAHFPRLRLGAWDLLYRVLRNAIGNRNPDEEEEHGNL